MVNSSRPLPMLPVRIHSLTPIQNRLLHDWAHRFYINPSGRRSRKTLIFSRKLLLKALRKQNGSYFQGAPTHDQAKAIFWEPLKRSTQAFWKKIPNESELTVTLLNDTKIQVVGLDKPKRVEGRPWDGFHLTEFDDLKPGAWELNLRPLLSDTNGFAYLDGVPDDSALLYDLALKVCGGAIPKTLPGIGTFMEGVEDPEWCFYHWFSSDVLSPKEILSAQNSMDIRMFRREYEGSFEKFEGTAYHAFGQWNFITSFVFNPKKPVYVGMDFNYDPMCSVLMQDAVIDGKPAVVAFKVNAFENCDTEAACERIIEDTGKNLKYVIYPDPACKIRSAHGAGESDIAIIRSAFQRRLDTAAGGSYRIKVRDAHPGRKDRLNAFNAMLKNAAGETRFYVVKDQCKPLVNDFQKCSMEEFLNGKFKDPKLGHSSDGAGYFLEMEYPIKNGYKMFTGA